MSIKRATSLNYNGIVDQEKLLLKVLPMPHAFTFRSMTRFDLEGHNISFALLPPTYFAILQTIHQDNFRRF